MIQIVRIGDRLCPRAFCDYCGQVIESYKDGNVEWVHIAPDAVDGTVSLPFFTHKRCSLGWEDHHGGRAKWGATELGPWLLHLLHNTKADTEAAQEQADRLDELFSGMGA